MLINAAQPEELRVALVDGQELYDLDVEVPSAEQKKGNIYKGRVSRIEPSLEACFVEYGAERHGFLPLREIAPSYQRTDSQPGERRSIRDAIQEGQEVIVQVEKEERGTKGAALTTFVSLAGRYLVLMPNNPRAGGVSRRIEGEDREEIRDILSQLPIPDGMGVIVRTAGVGRSLEQLTWDLEYLTRVWAAVGQAAESRSGPFLIYQESNVIIRALRDHFTSDIGEVLIDDAGVCKDARAFVELVMPEHLSKVRLYEDKVPLFTRFQIESQIDAAYERLVRLPSGGALVFDTTEALVAIDVNSARATQGSDINETAFNTNLEAADEIARQLRVRDIGGLIVVDFIDMGTNRHQREVEQRFHRALELDRARVQVGRISRFGLMELSRQRLRPSLGEAVLERCPRCEGRGMIRSVESLAISVLRLVHEEAVKERTGRVVAEVPVPVATYLMNEKRPMLAEIESRCGVSVVLLPNPHLDTPAFQIERLREDQLGARQQPSHHIVQAPVPTVPAAAGPRPEAPAVGTVQPIAPPPARAQEQKTRRGLFQRILKALGGEETVQETPSAREDTAARPRSRNATRRGSNRRTSGRAGSQSARRRGSGPGATGQHRSRRQGAPERGDGGENRRRRQQTRSPEGPQEPIQKKSAEKAETRSEGNKAAGPSRSRTRRGRRGGRRRRSGAQPSDQASLAEPGQNGPAANAPAQGESLPPTPKPQTKPAEHRRERHPGEPRDKKEQPASVHSTPPAAAETPRLAALYAREEVPRESTPSEQSEKTSSE